MGGGNSDLDPGPFPKRMKYPFFLETCESPLEYGITIIAFCQFDLLIVIIKLEYPLNKNFEGSLFVDKSLVLKNS